MLNKVFLILVTKAQTIINRYVRKQSSLSQASLSSRETLHYTCVIFNTYFIIIKKKFILCKLNPSQSNK